MQVYERLGLRTIYHYCWGCGQMKNLDAATCLCTECYQAELERISALPVPAEQFPHVDVDGHVWQQRDFELGA